MSATTLSVKCNKGGKKGRPTAIEISIRDAVHAWLHGCKLFGSFSTMDLGSVKVNGLDRGSVQLVSSQAVVEDSTSCVELVVGLTDDCRKVKLALLDADLSLFAKATGLGGEGADDKTESPPVSQRSLTRSPPAKEAPAMAVPDKPHFVLERIERGLQVETKVIDQRSGAERGHCLIRRDTSTNERPVLIKVHSASQQSVVSKPSEELAICLIIDDWLHQAKQGGQFGVILTNEVRDYNNQRFQLAVDLIGKPETSRLLLAVQVGGRKFRRVHLECSTQERANQVCSALRALQSVPAPMRPVAAAKPAPRPEAKADGGSQREPTITFVRSSDGELKYLTAERVFVPKIQGHALAAAVSDLVKQLELIGGSGTFTLQRDGELREQSLTDGLSIIGDIQIRLPLAFKMPDGNWYKIWLSVSSFEQAAAIARLLRVQAK